MTSRRNILKTGLVLNVASLTGCLRFSKNQQDNQSSTEEIASVDNLFNVEWNKNEGIYPISVDENFLYGSGSGGIIKLSLDTGEVQWQTTPQHSREDNIIQAIQPGESTVCVAERSDPDADEQVRIFGLNPEDGTEVWYFEGEFTNWFLSSTTFATSDQHACFAHQSRDGSITNIWILDKESGDRISKISLNEENEETDIRYIQTVLIRDERLFLFGNKLEVHDITSGSVINTVELNLPYALISNGTIYAGNDSVVKKDIDTADPSWRTELSTRITATPKISKREDKLIVGTKTGVHCINTSTGNVEWKYRTAGEINDYDGGVELIEGLAWTFDDAGHLSVIDVSNGNRLYDEQQKPNSDNPSDMVASESKLYLSLYNREESPQTEIPKGTSCMSMQYKY